MVKVFERRAKVPVPSYELGAMFRSGEKKGEIGLELEFEGAKLPSTEDSPFGSYKTNLIPKQWSYHHDGSLRGETNAEYVLVKPIMFDEVKKAIDDLWDMFAKADSRLDDSNRTSVHVHLNAQKWHFNRLASFIALYLSVEEILTEWCGDYRVGNLFCLRAKDAPDIVQAIKKFLVSEGGSSLPESMHYAGLNCHALLKFGSIEVRALRGVSEPKVILDWVDILRRIYDLSGEFRDPRHICDNFSGYGATNYLSFVLGPMTNTVLSGINFDNQKIMSSVYEGIRLAQDICYCRDWSLLQPVSLGADPFGRSTKKVQTQLEQYYQSMWNDINAATPSPLSGYVLSTNTVNTAQGGPTTTFLAPETSPFESLESYEEEDDEDEDWYDDDDYEEEVPV